MANHALTEWCASPRRLVFLHGFDADPDAYDLDALATAVRSSAVIRPVGPVPTGTGNSWWPGAHGEPPSPEDQMLMVASIDAQLADRLPDTRDPVVLIGFSQGAAAALTYALVRAQSDPPIAAIICVAGFLAFAAEEPTGPGPASDPPILFVHPTDDDVVDLFLGERASRVLGRVGFRSELREVDGGHEWSDRVVGPIAEFLGC